MRSQGKKNIYYSHNHNMTEQETIQKDMKKDIRRDFASIVRIAQTDIPGTKTTYVGLTYIKGISWTLSNAICILLSINPQKKVSELSQEEIEIISSFLKHPKGLPVYLMNRQNDFETGDNSHLSGSDLDMKKEFDLRRLKKIRSYRGLRHAFGHPSRGQRTRSNFRAGGKKKAVGVQKKKGAKKK
jgi:small subunit ribosomal protein S13